MDKADIERIKMAVDIVALISENVSLQRKGKYFFGLCPFHEEKTPSFAVDPERRRFRCYGCGASGDALEYLEKAKGLTFQEALRELAGRAGVEIKISSPGPVFNRPLTVPERRKEVFSPPAIEFPNKIWREHSVKFLIESHLELMEDKAVLRYLGGRGIPPGTAEMFGLGWNSKDGYRDRGAWGLDATSGKSLYLPAGITIPSYRDRMLVRIRIRRREGESRYFIVAGSASCPMVFPPGETVPAIYVIVESELDAIMIAGLQTPVGVVATGSAFAKPDEALHETLSRAKRLLIALDNDTAGQNAARWWLDIYDHARRVAFPDGAKDPGELYQKTGDIMGWLNENLPERLRRRERREGGEKI